MLKKYIYITILIYLFVLLGIILQHKIRETFNYNKKDVILVHVGKSGGSTIKEHFKFKSFHHRKAIFYPEKKYIISIRHPIKRFVSAYNMSNSLIKYNKLGVSDSKALIRYKKDGYYYSKKYDNDFKKFNSLNDLCEQIFTSNVAFSLVNSLAPHQHLGKNMSWYLDNGEFIKKYHENIIYVTKQETLNDDINAISNILGLSVKNIKNRRVKLNKDVYLSSLAINNLHKLYENTEYKTLKTLYDYNFIDKNYLDYCYTYTI
uniref:Sulfotransferase family protein n=1 Tax=Megaviridae environmental sample TaxID=1737588 RepID=A0A5J6VKG9_9VIRU|nr:MAG: hypothetical protein [Megaviridae environmental sample]